jgi:hypothetical protein
VLRITVKKQVISNFTSRVIGLPTGTSDPNPTETNFRDPLDIFGRAFLSSRTTVNLEMFSSIPNK